MRAKKLSTLIILLFTAAFAHAATRLVPAQYPNIQAAIDDCNNGDEVIASEGTYYENLLFRGKNITLRSTNPEDPNVVAATVIDGNGLGSVITFSGSENYLCVLSGFTITGGRNYSTGGGIDGLGTAATISHCFIAGNYGRNGGGIRHSMGTIADCIITNNQASETGGGLGLCHNSKVTNCIISNNSAKNYGGGTGYSNYITINNCLITNNTAGKGGGLASPHHAKIVNCTIVGNKSTIEGAGGVYYGDGSYIVSSIVWGNAPYQVDKYIARYYCCIQGGASGIHIINRDPRFVNPTEGDYHLLPDSPCIEHGHPDYTPLPDTDIDGYPRIIGRVVDMGIYEFIFDTPHIGVLAWSVAFNAFQDRANPEPQTLSIYNAGTDSLNWHITENCQWLQVNPTSGITTTGTDELTLTVDITGMPWGVYDCNLTISDPCAPNNPLIIPISLQITGPILSVSPASFNFLASKENPTPSSQTLHIQNIGGGTLGWQLTADCNWLSVSDANGSSTGEIDEVILTVGANSLPTGRYTYDLVVSEDTASNNPITLPIGLILFALDPIRLQTIQDAIDDANDGDVITVADGIYVSNGAGLDFAGKSITVRSKNGPEGCIIDCNYCSRGFYFHSGEDVNSVVDGFSIVNGYADYGAGIYCRDSSPTILNCIMTDNIAKYAGSGISCWGWDSSSRINNCIISDNFVQHNNSACAIQLASGDEMVTNSEISGNYGGGSAGIGIYDSAIVRNCNIRNNEGQGIQLVCSEYPSIENCIISGNLGGIYLLGNGSRCTTLNPKITNCVITGNRFYGLYWTEEYHNDYPAPFVENCIIWHNFNYQVVDDFNALTMVYSNVPGGWPGIGNIDADPCFVNPGYWDPKGTLADANDDFWVDGDYHLKSRGWRWDAQRRTWTWDTVTSRCIDAGDPDALLRDEPLFVPVDPTGYWGANLRIDMGAYGGTAEASIPPHGWAIRTDYNNDGILNFTDFAYWSPYANTASQWGSDHNYNCTDLAILAESWLNQTDWFKAPSPGVPFHIPLPGQASAPNPPNGAVGIRLDPVLGWEAGAGATSHNVYFGTSDPPTFQASTTATTFVPGYLSNNTIYYWRIDEVSSFGRTAGPVWTFTTGTGGGGGR